MKITINIKSKVNQSLLVPFFKAKKTYLQANWGFSTFMEHTSISVDDEYLEKLGETTSYGEFLMDCIHYDLCVVSINGQQLKNKKDEEIIINPYNEEYYIQIKEGYNVVEIELFKIGEDVYHKKGKSNRKLLLS